MPYYRPDQGKLMWPVEKSNYECVEVEDYRDDDESLRNQRFIDELNAGPGRSARTTLCIRARQSRWSRLRFADDGSPETSGMTESVRNYNPLTKYRLFREFAELQETPESIIGFANQYGLLGLNENELEPLSAWYGEIHRMRRHVEMYDLAREDDPESTNEALKRLEESYVPWMNKKHRPRDLLGHPLEEKDLWMDKLKRSQFNGSVRDAAMWEVRHEINRVLERQASPVLVAPDHFSPEAEGLLFVPHTLIAAMWLRFAFQVARMRKQNKCQQCSKFFWLKLKGAKDKNGNERKRSQRLTSRYCSDACKVAAHRARKSGAAPEDPQGGSP